MNKFIFLEWGSSKLSENVILSRVYHEDFFALDHKVDHFSLIFVKSASMNLFLNNNVFQISGSYSLKYVLIIWFYHTSTFLHKKSTKKLSKSHGLSKFDNFPG